MLSASARSHRPSLLTACGVVIAVILGGLSGCSGTTRNVFANITLDGQKVSDPAGSIATIDQQWKSGLSNGGAVVNVPDAAKCWFEVKGDNTLAPEVMCGPVRFAASDAMWQVATIGVGYIQSNTKMTAILIGDFTSVPGTLPTGVTLVRPDGSKPDMSVTLDLPAGKTFPTDAMQSEAVYPVGDVGQVATPQASPTQPLPSQASGGPDEPNQYAFWLGGAWKIEVSAPSQYAGTVTDWWQAPSGYKLVSISATWDSNVTGGTWSLSADGKTAIGPVSFDSSYGNELTGTIAVPNGESSAFVVTVEGHDQSVPLDGSAFKAAVPFPASATGSRTQGTIQLSDIGPDPVLISLDNSIFQVNLTPRDDAGNWAPDGEIWVAYGTPPGEGYADEPVKIGEISTAKLVNEGISMSVSAGDLKAVADGANVAGQCTSNPSGEYLYFSHTSTTDISTYVSCEVLIPVDTATLDLEATVTFAGTVGPGSSSSRPLSLTATFQTGDIDVQAALAGGK